MALVQEAYNTPRKPTPFRINTNVRMFYFMSMGNLTPAVFADSSIWQACDDAFSRLSLLHFSLNISICNEHPSNTQLLFSG